MEQTKKSRLNYNLTHKKLEAAVNSVLKERKEPTVRSVAKRAGVSASTAYEHKCQDMILRAFSEQISEQMNERKKRT